MTEYINLKNLGHSLRVNFRRGCKFLGRKKRGNKYEPQKDSSLLPYQTNNVSTAETTSSQSHEIMNNAKTESAERPNNNTFFRNGWVSNLEENKRLTNEDDIIGYGSTRSEPKILKSIKLSSPEICKNSERDKTDRKPIIRDFPRTRFSFGKSPERGQCNEFDDVINLGYISS